MDNLNTYFEVLNWASSFLEKAGKEASIAEYLLMERQQFSRTDLLLHLRKPIPSEVKQQLQADLELILADIPPQYIIGFCDFYEHRFKVSTATLIPRPETEELVALCLSDNLEVRESLKVIDVGTGTGAIGLSLKSARPNWEVIITDISHEALLIAKENAEQLQARVRVEQGSTLEPLIEKKEWVDIIVSNPPYIDLDEWDVMDDSVRKHEPKTALFADNKGLAIYEKIAQEAPLVLKEDGRMYLEIGYRQGTAVQALFQEAFPNKQVHIIKDLSGLDRIVKVS